MARREHPTLITCLNPQHVGLSSGAAALPSNETYRDILEAHMTLTTHTALVKGVHFHPLN